MNRRILVDNQWVTFLEDQFQLPNGADCTYYHAQKSDAVMAIAIDGTQPDPHTYIVSQHRHPIEKSIWQFPIGGFDSATEDPCIAAARELKEETGVVATQMQLLGSFFADPGFTNQKLFVCATRKILSVGAQQLETSEQGLISKKIPVGNISALIDSGDMGDAWGLAGYYYLEKFLSQSAS